VTFQSFVAMLQDLIVGYEVRIKYRDQDSVIRLNAQTVQFERQYGLYWAACPIGGCGLLSWERVEPELPEKRHA
jgi:hypothetical protein